jgi:hypothetical protein
MYTLEQIKNWIVYEAGICPAGDNHFGGDPSANPKLNLKIQQRPLELASCIKFLLDEKNRGERLDYYMEIGACSGGTTFAMHHFINFKELLIIDDGGIASEQYVNERDDQSRGENLGFIPRVEIIGLSSDKRVIDHALNISKLHLYDVLFIDGDHSYEGVKSDTINYLPMLRDGGYVIFHDTCSIEGVMKWISELDAMFPNLHLVKEISESDEHTAAFENGIGLKIFKIQNESI